MSLISYLQGWIGIVGVTALGNTISCYRNHTFLSERLYTEQSEEVTALFGRMFGTWTFLSALLRIYCAARIYDKGIYHLTMLSFLLAFLHFLSEAFIYKTVDLANIGVIMPVFISSFSFLFMLFCYKKLFRKPSFHEECKMTMEHVIKSTKKQLRKTRID